MTAPTTSPVKICAYNGNDRLARVVPICAPVVEMFGSIFSLPPYPFLICSAGRLLDNRGEAAVRVRVCSGLLALSFYKMLNVNIF